MANDGQVKTFDDVLITRTNAGAFRLVSFNPSGVPGVFQFTVSNSVLTSTTVLVSTNLVDWAELPGALQHSNGIFTLADPAAATQPYRFYQLHWP